MKRITLSLAQNRNILFRTVSFFSVVILLLTAANHLRAQTDTTSSYLIIPDSIHNETTMAPEVIINHSMIERFLTVSYPSANMGFRKMIMTYGMDSIVEVLQSEMKRNVEYVSGSDLSLEGDAPVEDNRKVLSDPQFVDSSN